MEAMRCRRLGRSSSKMSRLRAAFCWLLFYRPDFWTRSDAFDVGFHISDPLYFFLFFIGKGGNTRLLRLIVSKIAADGDGRYATVRRVSYKLSCNDSSPPVGCAHRLHNGANPGANEMATGHQEKDRGAIAALWSPVPGKFKCVSDRHGRCAGAIIFDNLADAQAYCEKTGDVLIAPTQEQTK